LRKYLTFFFSCLLSFFSLGLAHIGNENSIPLYRAWIVESIEGGKRGIIEQNIIEDISQKILTKDSNISKIHGQLTSLDRAKKRELFLIFNAKNIDPILEGYLIISFMPFGTGFLEIDSVFLKHYQDDYYLEITGNSNVKTRANLFYASYPYISSDTELEGIILEKRKRFKLIKFRNVFLKDFSLKSFSSKFTQKKAYFKHSIVKELQKLEICSAILSTMEEKFSLKNKEPNIWSHGKISFEIINDVLSEVELLQSRESKKNFKIFFYLNIPELNIEFGNPNIRPDVRRKYIIQKEDDKTFTVAFINIRVIFLN
jgi:hypothetical protein